jgi:hypothetical protein
MPETPEVSEGFEIEVPRAQDVPIREGEEGSQALLNLEDSRRRDSVVADLKQRLKLLEGTSADEMRTKFASSPSARRRQLSARKKMDELVKLTHRRGDHWEGPCTPATVVNLNPVPLTLQGELQRWSIPPGGKGQLINLSFRGRRFVGSYLTIKTPHLFPSHTGTINDRQSGVDMPAVDYNYVPPLGLAHQFYSHFVKGSADAQGMGGILIFEGDIHTLDRKRLEKSQGMIWKPKKDITLDGFGDVVYTVEEVDAEDELEAAVTMQRNYCEGRISEGHGFATAQAQAERNQLNNDHRVWHNYALEMGYIEKALFWATERLIDKPSVQAIFCPDCHERQTHADQWFCPNCNSPFDPLKAFLAGKVVSPDRLAVYEGEEWDMIAKEHARRQAKIAILETGPAKETKKPKAE